MAREAEEKKQDEALMQSCPSSSLVHIPLLGSNLSPEAPRQLQGSLAVPPTCSVRLLRRIFARAVQVGDPLVLGVATCILLCAHLTLTHCIAQQYGVFGNKEGACTELSAVYNS